MESVQDLGGPFLRRWIKTLRGARVGVFVCFFACELPIQEIRHHQKLFCHIQHRRTFETHAPELIERIDLHELNATVPKDICLRDLVERLKHRTVGSSIPIAETGTEQIILFIQQHVIDAPCIHSDTSDASSELLGSETKSPFDLLP